MKRSTGLLLGSLLWACPVCDLLAVTLLPLATAWSLGRWGAAGPGAIARWLTGRPRRAT